MPLKRSFLTVTDQFCGAGGSSIGAVSAGAELRLALNHWRLAIDTHNTNFPQAAHDCTDISAADPRRYPSTDILITSPECTNHSLAKGRSRALQQADLFGNQPDPGAERSRATMWDVPRFAEYHRYNLIIVENVVDARHWVTWDAWLHAMRLLGYDHQVVYYNSQFAHPTPQSRDRMYVVFWRHGNPIPDLDIRPTAWCVHCQQNVEAVQSWKHSARKWGRYNEQYVYRCPVCAADVRPYYYAAANIIDWSLPAPRIGDRQRPLKDKTLKRIQAGLDKFARPPFVIETVFGGERAGRSHTLTEPFSTQTTRQSAGLVVPPFLIDLRGENAPKSLADAISTIVASGNHHGLVFPFLTSYYNTDDGAPIHAPLPTVTTVDRHALVVPPFLVGNYTPGWSHPLTDPTGAITIYDHHSLIVPPFILGYYTRLTGLQAAVSGIDEPLPTQSTQPRHYLLTPKNHPTQPPTVDDCGFRMLQPHEIRQGMAFPDSYVILGNKRDQVRQLGNAVTPPVMSLLLQRAIATLQ